MMFMCWIIYSNHKTQRAIRTLLVTARDHDTEKYVVRNRLSEAQATIAHQTEQISSILQQNTILKEEIKTALRDNTKLEEEIKTVLCDNTKLNKEITSLNCKVDFLSNIAFRLSCNRAIVLATQVLYLYIGRQPRATKKGPKVFESALKKDPKYPFVLKQTFGADELELQAALTAKFDELLETRNTLVHPSSVSALMLEAKHLVATLNNFAHAGHALSDSEIAAKMVLASVY
jgi:hypothetical protein